jgi:hypothetical protein
MQIIKDYKVENIECPNCGMKFLPDATYCVRCGASLTSAPKTDAKANYFRTTRKEEYSPVNQPAEISDYLTSLSNARDNRYSALKGIASLCNTLAIGVIVLAGLIILGGLISIDDSPVIGLGAISFAFLNGAIGYIFLKVISESILVILDIEINTGRTAALMEALLKHNRPLK